MQMGESMLALVSSLKSTTLWMCVRYGVQHTSFGQLKHPFKRNWYKLTVHKQNSNSNNNQRFDTNYLSKSFRKLIDANDKFSFTFLDLSTRAWYVFHKLFLSFVKLMILFHSTRVSSSFRLGSLLYAVRLSTGFSLCICSFLPRKKQHNSFPYTYIDTPVVWHHPFEYVLAGEQQLFKPINKKVNTH